MKAVYKIPLILLSLTLFHSCNSDDDSNDIDCPKVNNTFPLLLGNWIFTGTIIDGNLLIEDCDLLTTRKVTCENLEDTSYGGNNCSNSNTNFSDYRIDNNNLIYLDDLGNDVFIQEIITLNDNILTLQNVGNGTSIVTENWERE